MWPLFDLCSLYHYIQTKLLSWTVLDVCPMSTCWHCYFFHLRLFVIWPNHALPYNSKVSLIQRKRILNQCVLPTMTNGCETWNITKFLEQKWWLLNMPWKEKMLHIILHDKVKNSVVRSRSKVTDVLEKIKEANWRWAGHVSRREDNRWTKCLTEWQPRTGKRRGRQKRRWRDDITTYIGTTCGRTAQYRRRWQLLEEGYIRQWMM